MHTSFILAASALATAAPAPAGQGTPYDEFNAAAARASLTAQAVRGNVSMLQGAGGNITALAGREGVFMVDAGVVASEQVASEQKVKAALRSLTPGISATW
jgi:hypothetical protein